MNYPDMCALSREELNKEPCACIRCSACGGSGRICIHDQFAFEEHDPCEECEGSGIFDTCDRCQLMDEHDHEVPY